MVVSDHGRRAFAVEADGARAVFTTKLQADALVTIDPAMAAKAADILPVAP